MLLSALSLALAGVMGAQFHYEPPPDPVGDAVLGLGIAALLPGAVNTGKAVGPPVPLAPVVAVLDVVMCVVGAAAIVLGLADS